MEALISRKADRLIAHKGYRTQRELADAAGCDETTLHNALRAGKSVRVSTAIAIARALDVTVEYLFDDDVPILDASLDASGLSSAAAPPPFAIAPWPPHGITWVEVQQAISEYVVRRAQSFAQDARAGGGIGTARDAATIVEGAAEAANRAPQGTRGKKRGA